MTEAQWLELITDMQLLLNRIKGINCARGQMPPVPDGRCLAIAATHLETSMLWVANARQS